MFAAFKEEYDKLATMTDKLKDKLHEKAEQEVEVRGHKMEKADIFKFVGSSRSSPSWC